MSQALSRAPLAEEEALRPDSRMSTRPGASVPAPGWTPVCLLEDIAPNTGVCALLGDQQIAVVRVAARSSSSSSSSSSAPGGPLSDAEAAAQVFALSNFDPFSKAFVLSRGIVGDRGGTPKIASPMYKQNFDLRTGRCLDDPNVSIPRYDTRVRGGVVEVYLPETVL